MNKVKNCFSGLAAVWKMVFAEVIKAISQRRFSWMRSCVSTSCLSLDNIIYKVCLQLMQIFPSVLWRGSRRCRFQTDVCYIFLQQCVNSVTQQSFCKQPAPDPHPAHQRFHICGPSKQQLTVEKLFSSIQQDVLQ